MYESKDYLSHSLCLYIISAPSCGPLNFYTMMSCKTPTYILYTNCTWSLEWGRGCTCFEASPYPNSTVFTLNDSDGIIIMHNGRGKCHLFRGLLNSTSYRDSNKCFLTLNLSFYVQQLLINEVKRMMISDKKT